MSDQLSKQRIILLLFLFQLVLATLRHFYFPIHDFLFAAIASTSVGVAIYFSEIFIFLPAYTDMQDVMSNQHWQNKLKLTYSILGFMACVTGVFTYDFYGWVVGTFVGLSNAISPAESTFVNPSEIQQNIIEHMRWTFLAPENLSILIPVMLSSTGFLVYFNLSRKYGPRADVYRAHDQSIVKSQLYEQESRLEIIMVGVGLGINYYFVLLFLFFAVVRHRAIMDFNSWIKERVEGDRPYKDTFDALVFEYYQNLCVLSFFIVPFLNSTMLQQNLFVTLLVLPLIAAILLHFYYRNATTLPAISSLLKAIISCCLIVAGFEQFVEHSANPLIMELASAFQMDSEIQTSYIDISKAIFFAFMVYMALEIWVDKDREYRANRDPFGSYFVRKVKWFLLFLLLRGVFVIMYFQGAGSIFPDVIVYYAIGIVLALPIDEGGEAFLRHTKEIYTVDELSSSRKLWSRRINSFLRLRNTFNVGFILICSIVVFLAGGGLVRILVVSLLPLIGIFYLVEVSKEWAMGKYYLNFEPRLLLINETVASILVLGFWRSKDKNNS